jgi:hypothetical protein
MHKFGSNWDERPQKSEDIAFNLKSVNLHLRVCSCNIAYSILLLGGGARLGERAYLEREAKLI